MINLDPDPDPIKIFGSATLVDRQVRQCRPLPPAAHRAAPTGCTPTQAIHFFFNKDKLSLGAKPLNPRSSDSSRFEFKSNFLIHIKLNPFGYGRCLDPFFKYSEN